MRINLSSLFKGIYDCLLLFESNDNSNTECTDYLELALQFGMIMMFACAFPLAFAFAALVKSFAFIVFGLLTNTVLFPIYIDCSSDFYIQNNITEIRTDALKLLAMHKRPFPRAATTIGAWLNIFQVLLFLDLTVYVSSS